MNNKKTFYSLLLIVLIFALIVFPLVFVSGAEFMGADGEAEELITEISPDYEPWFTSVWEPPSGEIESLLFAMQGALGAGFIFYYLGYKRGLHELKQRKQP